MPYVYSQVEDLDGTEKVGSKQCAVLVQHYAGAPAAALWREGDVVMGTPGILKGTAIATFVDGRYPNNSHGNHAALYVKQDAGGIYVVDQWCSDVTKPRVSMRYIRKKGKNKAGDFVDPSNNADAFSVIK